MCNGGAFRGGGEVVPGDIPGVDSYRPDALLDAPSRSGKKTSVLGMYERSYLLFPPFKVHLPDLIWDILWGGMKFTDLHPCYATFLS